MNKNQKDNNVPENRKSSKFWNEVNVVYKGKVKIMKTSSSQIRSTIK